MIITSVDDSNIDQVLKEFSSDELINLSDDLLQVAIGLTLQDNLDISDIKSVAMGNDLLAVIPKIIASRINKAALYTRKFAQLKNEDLIFAGYSISNLRGIQNLLEDVISLLERRTLDDLHALYSEVFEELKDSHALDPAIYRNALEKVNEAYRMQSRHVMNLAINVYKQIMTDDIEHLLRKEVAELEEYQEYLNNAIELLETSEVGDKFSAQLAGLRKTLIRVLEALNTNTIGAGFSQKKLFYIHTILYHIRDNPEEYIFEVVRRFADLSRKKELLSYMKPEEIAIRYRTRYIKHNRVLLGFISNPISVGEDFILEITNNILKNLSIALNIKLQFIRTGKLAEEIIQAAAQKGAEGLRAYPQEELDGHYGRLKDVIGLLEKYTIRSDYLETLLENCYQAVIAILEWFKDEYLPELVDLLRRYQTYAARKLFALRISTVCIVISSHTTEELSELASERILNVCRDLIQYQYDFLKPTSPYMESLFDLEQHRVPVLANIEEATQRIQAKKTSQQEEGQPSPQAAVPTYYQSENKSKPLFSQLVIDCLALKVQELDETPRVLEEDKSISKHDMRMRIQASKERIEHFLKQYEEETKLFIEYFQSEQLEEFSFDEPEFEANKE